MRTALCIVLLTILLVGPLVFANGMNDVRASTVPPSIISSDTTWTAINSPYILSGPTLVASGATLTIQAGATVNLNAYYLQINGTLNAVGTSSAPIYINSASVNAGQIKFNAASTSWNQQTEIGCTIQNAVINQTVISIANCSVLIRGSTFNDAADMQHLNVAISTNGGSSIISNNNFYLCGLDISDNSAISNNVIGGGIGVFGGSPVVSNNQISGRSSYFGIGRSYDRDYDTVAIIRGSPVVSSNTINGVVGFDVSEYEDNDYSIFNHALVTGNTINEGHVCDVGVDIGAGTGTIDIVNNIISEVPTGIRMLNTTAILVKIQGNLIANSNATAIFASGNITILDNTLANSGIGIILSNVVSPIISGNNIENSNQYSLKLMGTSSNIDASNNWWGTTNQQTISQSIYDLKNDFNLGKVTFLPILNTRNSAAPPITVPLSTPTPTPSPSSTSSPNVITPKNATNIRPLMPITPGAPTATPTPAATETTPEYPILALLILLVTATLAILAGAKKLPLRNKSSSTCSK